MRRPNADSVAGAKPESQQSNGQAVHTDAQLPIGPVHLLVHHNESVAVAVSFAGEIEACADGFINQRNDRPLASLPLIASHDCPPVTKPGWNGPDTASGAAFSQRKVYARRGSGELSTS